MTKRTFAVRSSQLMQMIAVFLFLTAIARAQDHYCGVYSAYAVLDHFGVKLDFEELLEPEFVSGFRGSTDENIVAALERNGVCAASYSGLNVFDLRVADAPVILHVRGSQGLRNYEHWVVYLGEQDGMAVILDPSRSRSLIDYPRLLAMWDTVGIATSNSLTGLVTWRILGQAQRWIVLIVFGCVAVFFVTLGESRFLRPLPRPSTAGYVLGGISLIGAFALTSGLCDLLESNGLMRNSVARASVASVRSHTDFPTLTLEEAAKIYDHAPRDKYVWVDARFQPDFEHGHIPGALNIPIDATFAHEDRTVRQIPADSEIIVYCQSAGCGFADAVAERLRGHGFRRIKLFRPGYAEWAASGHEVFRKAELTTKSGVREVEFLEPGTERVDTVEERSGQ